MPDVLARIGRFVQHRFAIDACTIRLGGRGDEDAIATRALRLAQPLWIPDAAADPGQGLGKVDDAERADDRPQLRVGLQAGQKFLDGDVVARPEPVEGGERGHAAHVFINGLQLTHKEAV